MKMSLLSSIKAKLSTATLDFSKGLPFLSTKQQDKPVTETEAGFALLSLYQKYWSDIHRASDENASRAQAVDVMVTDITTKVDWQVTNVNQFVMELTKFAEIQSQIDEAKSRISGLQTSCSEVEDELVLLEDLCSEMQQNNNRFEHEYQLRKYRERKHLELEQVKANLAKQHASRVQRFEERMCSQLEERHKVFEAAFQQQMKNYRTLGRMPDDSVMGSTSPASRDLSEITVDEDRSQLDDFLASSTETPNKAVEVLEPATDNTSATAVAASTEERLDSAESVTEDKVLRSASEQT